MHRTIKGFLVAIAILLVCGLQSQESTTYSRFGFGIMSDNNFIPCRAMGGLGASYSSREGINFANPASYAKLDIISFEGGVTGGVNKVSSNFNSGSTANANLSYLSFSLPIKKNVWVSSMSLVPFSQKDYLVVDTNSISNTNSIANIFEGSGKLYSVNWGNGFKYKDFSIGFNIGYLFGSINATTLSIPLDTDLFVLPYSFSTLERDKLSTSGLLWNVGVQYSIPLIEKEDISKNIDKLSLDLGIAYNAKYDIGSKSKVESSKFSVYSPLLITKDVGETYTNFVDNLLAGAALLESTGQTGIDIDTFLAPTTQSLTLKMPTNIEVGFTFVQSHNNISVWKAGFDFKYTPWSKYAGYEQGGGGQLNDSWRIALGGEIYPLFLDKDKSSKSKKLGQLKYRAGFYYSKSPINVQNTNINEFGINFGIGIPITMKEIFDDGYKFRQVHPFSLGFEVGSRGTRNNDLVKDNFIRINFGITLNEQWFVKRKYN